MPTIIPETRQIFAIYSDGEHALPIIAWYIDGQGDPPEAMVIAGDSPNLEWATQLPGFQRLEYNPQNTVVHIPIWMEKREEKMISCPHPSGNKLRNRWLVKEFKLWAVARAFDDGDALTQARWERRSRWSRNDIKAIIFLLHYAGLCSKPAERRKTKWNEGVTRDDVISFVARMTGAPPPPKVHTL